MNQPTERTPTLPAGPWGWIDDGTGNARHLVANDGRRRVVLTAQITRPTVECVNCQYLNAAPAHFLATCSDDGVLEQLTLSHPVARAIAAAGGPGPLQLTELENAAAVGLAQRIESLAAMHLLKPDQLERVLQLVLQRMAAA